MTARGRTHHLQRLRDGLRCLFPPRQTSLSDRHARDDSLSPTSLHALELLKDVVRFLVLCHGTLGERSARGEELR